MKGGGLGSSVRFPEVTDFVNHQPVPLMAQLVRMAEGEQDGSGRGTPESWLEPGRDGGWTGSGQAGVAGGCPG